jgi:FkbM family methyltransferase
MAIVRYVGARAKNALNFAMKRAAGYCSQWGQDKWVIRDMFHGMRGGYFVDIGAYEGYIASNSYVLEKTYGWKGICNDALFKKLERRRSCILVNSCISDREEEVPFLEAGPFGGMTTSYPEHHDRLLTKLLFKNDVLDDQGKYKSVLKRTRTLESVLDEHSAPSVIDYLSIDTEGAEYRILKDFPFDRYTFLTLTIEHNSQEPARTMMRDLLASKGYVLAVEGRHDDFFYHPSIEKRLSK